MEFKFKIRGDRIMVLTTNTLNSTSIERLPKGTVQDLRARMGFFSGRKVQIQPPKSAKIQFEKSILTKDTPATKAMIGSMALTQDNNHKGWLHVLIYIGQVVNSILTGTKTNNINLCHGQAIIDVNDQPGKEGQMVIAHSIFPGIKTSSEDHRKDNKVTSLSLYRPVDKKIRDLFVKHAKQTTVNFKDAGLDPKSKDFKSRVKKEVGQFSILDGIKSLFTRQVLKPIADVQKETAYATADLIKGDKFRDKKGNLASYFCTAYITTLMQGTCMVAALSEKEKASYKVKTRDEIANDLFKRITEKKKEDRVAATYWENDFMQLDARHTMSYLAGDVFDKASIIKKTGPTAAAA